MADDDLLPWLDPGSQHRPNPEELENGRRNRAAIRYMNQCGILRMEPDKHKLMDILMGRDRDQN
jgi:hypothetical protein